MGGNSIYIGVKRRIAKKSPLRLRWGQGQGQGPEWQPQPCQGKEKKRNGVRESEISITAPTTTMGNTKEEKGNVIGEAGTLVFRVQTHDPTILYPSLVTPNASLASSASSTQHDTLIWGHFTS